MKMVIKLIEWDKSNREEVRKKLTMMTMTIIVVFLSFLFLNNIKNTNSNLCTTLKFTNGLHEDNRCVFTVMGKSSRPPIIFYDFQC